VFPIAFTFVPAVAGTRFGVILASLFGWHWTQKLLARRNPTADAAVAGQPGISDGIHRLTAGINRRLNENPKQANLLLILSSGVIDALGIYILAAAIFGPTIEPFLGLFMVFALRQIVQAFCPLPPPAGMIWRSPGVPSLLVTYGTSCDLFFSGHTAIAVYGCATLAAAFGPVGIAIGCAIAAFEIGTVLVLRAHYTMDVFAGAVAALYVHRLGPACGRVDRPHRDDGLSGGGTRFRRPCLRLPRDGQNRVSVKSTECGRMVSFRRPNAICRYELGLGSRVGSRAGAASM
jgi:hypothetical protein